MARKMLIYIRADDVIVNQPGLKFLICNISLFIHSRTFSLGYSDENFAGQRDDEPKII